jgi:hypothetical protein
VSYKNGNEESKEESDGKEEEVNPSPLFRNRYVFLTETSATGFRCVRFLFCLKANDVGTPKKWLPERSLEHELWQ